MCCIVSYCGLVFNGNYFALIFNFVTYRAKGNCIVCSYNHVLVQHCAAQLRAFQLIYYLKILKNGNYFTLIFSNIKVKNDKYFALI